ncbi:polyphenol oxidase family protein [Nesterenkonia lutea]|uniref:YfiH family protein n=1 Tax=Nesterenkonia lutea TaxID=272919 RepID=A0ABR9JE68_9MICC|nr:polyphenol oxidase family protein [Nesterenkonia lutea]MBE1524226.1 YfiH family protein [Nesterenkonia lutea]
MIQPPGLPGRPPSFWWQESLDDGVHLAFTSVEAGNLARHVGPQHDVEADRLRIQEAMGVPAGSLRFLDQVHSADVLDAQQRGGGAVADSPGAVPSGQGVPTGDAWVCADGSVPLAIMVADCLPVLLVGRRAEEDHRTPVTAAAHAGRPGLLSGVLENTVAAMRDRGAASITAWIGPGACGRCYEIPEQMVTEIAVARPAIASRTSWGTSALDLRAEAESVLNQHGVAVAELSGCTVEDESLFSHRRAPGAGRFAGLLWMDSAVTPSR